MNGIHLGWAYPSSDCCSSQRMAEPAMRKTPKERADVPTVLRKMRNRGTSGGLNAAYTTRMKQWSPISRASANGTQAKQHVGACNPPKSTPTTDPSVAPIPVREIGIIHRAAIYKIYIRRHVPKPPMQTSMQLPLLPYCWLGREQCATGRLGKPGASFSPRKQRSRVIFRKERAPSQKARTGSTLPSIRSSFHRLSGHATQKAQEEGLCRPKNTPQAEYQLIP